MGTTRIRPVLVALWPLLLSLVPGPTVDEIVRSGVKVHLQDGGVVVYPYGFSVRELTAGSELVGRGYRAVEQVRSGALSVIEIPSDAVYAVEWYDRELDPEGEQRALAPEMRPAHARFRSSPSVYTLNEEYPRFEAEAFSSNLIRRIESDDLDRLEGVSDARGHFVVMMANEALETQYVNQLQLEVVDHSSLLRALPTPDRSTVLVGRPAPFRLVQSRDGRNAGYQLWESDSLVYRTSIEIAERLTRSLTRDWIDLEVNVPSGQREVYLALRVRNTLFSSVLTEEVLRSGWGIRAIDMMSGESSRLSEMWRLYRWCMGNLGLWVELESGRTTLAVARIGGTGPTAWRDIGVAVPVERAGPTRIRLSFLADTWMIDEATVSFEGGRVDNWLVMAPDEVTCEGEKRLRDPYRMLRYPDDDYMTLFSGDVCYATFRGPSPVAAGTRTYFLRSRGFIVKWIEPEFFLAQSGFTGDLKLNDTTMGQATERWLAAKDEMEMAFEEDEMGAAEPEGEFDRDPDSHPETEERPDGGG